MPVSWGRATHECQHRVRYNAVMRYRALIFDFDGVIRHWDEADARAIEARHGLPERALDSVAFEPSLLDRAITGRIPDETWRLALRNALVRAHGEIAGAAADAWSNRRGRIDPAVVELAQAARARLRTGLLTNGTTRLEADLQTFKLDQAFDVVINSARVGFAKPDPRIFHVATVRLGFLPHECIFVDDTAGHVEAARAFGLTAIQFDGPASLRTSLAEAGIHL